MAWSKEAIEAARHAWMHRNLNDPDSEPIRDCLNAASAVDGDYNAGVGKAIAVAKSTKPFSFNSKEGRRLTADEIVRELEKLKKATP